jgi:hypothetical protein
MKFLAMFMAVNGIVFAVSSFTRDGLLPSGHGTGPVVEMILGIGLVFLSIYWLFGPKTPGRTTVNN